jgi:hypothetical protein
MAPASSPNSRYQKLPGAGGGFFHRSRLWIGDDHILLVTDSTVGERYRRFYFADIQGFAWRTTPWWIVNALWLACLALGLGAIAAFAFDELPGRLTMGLVAAVPLVFALLQLFRGPTCACFIKTAVQFERLAPLSRTRNIGRVLALLRPLIAQAQPAAAAPQPA